MLKDLEKFSRLKNSLKKKWKEELVDIFLFGSSIKGKISPNDIDLCLIFRNKINLRLVKDIEQILGDGYHISSLQIDNFFTNPHSLAKTLLLEGKSIISNKTLAETFGLESKSLYFYNISKLKPSKKVRFVYLLRGRKGAEGIISRCNGEFISNNAFFIPITKDNEILEVFDKWAVPYKRKKIMLMQ